MYILHFTMYSTQVPDQKDHGEQVNALFETVQDVPNIRAIVQRKSFFYRLIFTITGTIE